MDGDGIELDETSRAIIDREMAEGRFDTPGEVVRSALLLLQQREHGLAALRRAIDEGDSSGEPTPFDFEAYIDAKLGAGLPSQRASLSSRHVREPISTRYGHTPSNDGARRKQPPTSR